MFTFERINTHCVIPLYDNEVLLIDMNCGVTMDLLYTSIGDYRNSFHRIQFLFHNRSVCYGSDDFLINKKNILNFN